MSVHIHDITSRIIIMYAGLSVDFHAKKTVGTFCIHNYTSDVHTQSQLVHSSHLKPKSYTRMQGQGSDNQKIDTSRLDQGNRITLCITN